jgi:hypothetical protein
MERGSDSIVFKHGYMQNAIRLEVEPTGLSPVTLKKYYEELFDVALKPWMDTGGQQLLRSNDVNELMVAAGKLD